MLFSYTSQLVKLQLLVFERCTKSFVLSRECTVFVGHVRLRRFEGRNRRTCGLWRWLAAFCKRDYSARRETAIHAGVSPDIFSNHMQGQEMHSGIDAWRSLDRW